MGILIWHELALIIRSAPFWAASCVYVSVLVLFVLIWGEGVPLVGSGSNWEQFLGVQQALLTVVLPWTAVRCAARPRRELTLLALATATQPSRLVIASVVALMISLSALTLIAVPFVLIMQQIAAAPLEAAVAVFVPLAGLVSFVAVVATACWIVMGDALGAWISTTAAAIAASALLPLSGRSTIVWLGVASLLVIPVVLSANAHLMYLGDDKP